MKMGKKHKMHMFLLTFLLLFFSFSVVSAYADSAGIGDSQLPQAERRVYKCVSMGSTLTACVSFERQGDTLQPGEYVDYNTCMQNCHQCILVYKCPTNGNVFLDSGSCNSNCIQTADCTTSGTTTFSGCLGINMAGSIYYVCGNGNYIQFNGVNIVGGFNNTLTQVGCSVATNGRYYEDGAGADALEVYSYNGILGFAGFGTYVTYACNSCPCGSRPWGAETTLKGYSYQVSSYGKRCVYYYIGGHSGTAGTDFLLPIRSDVQVGWDGKNWSCSGQLYIGRRFDRLCNGKRDRVPYASECWSAPGTNYFYTNIWSNGNQLCSDYGCITATPTWVCPLGGGSTCSGSGTPKCTAGSTCNAKYTCSTNNQLLFSTLGECQNACR